MFLSGISASLDHHVLTCVCVCVVCVCYVCVLCVCVVCVCVCVCCVCVLCVCVCVLCVLCVCVVCVCFVCVCVCVHFNVSRIRRFLTDILWMSCHCRTLHLPTRQFLTSSNNNTKQAQFCEVWANVGRLYFRLEMICDDITGNLYNSVEIRFL